jgi:hypothetical protein
MTHILAVYSYAIPIQSELITTALSVLVLGLAQYISCTLHCILLAKPNPWCKYKVVQIWPGWLFVCKQVTVCPGHIWTSLYIGSEMTQVVQTLRIVPSLGSNYVVVPPPTHSPAYGRDRVKKKCSCLNITWWMATKCLETLKAYLTW